MPALIILIDEYAELADDAPDAIKHAEAYALIREALTVSGDIIPGHGELLIRLHPLTAPAVVTDTPRQAPPDTAEVAVPWTQSCRSAHPPFVGHVREVAMASRLKRLVPVTVNDVLDGHVALDLECLDRLYLHGYLGQLQVGGQVIRFLNHRGYPVPSPACLQQIGDAFRRRVSSFAEANHIPVVPLNAAGRKIEVMRPYLKRAAETGRSQVAAIGVAQEPQRVFIARKRDTDPARCPSSPSISRCPQFSFDKKDRRVTVFYFYLWDAGFGPAFIKVCTYSPGR